MLFKIENFQIQELLKLSFLLNNFKIYGVSFSATKWSFRDWIDILQYIMASLRVYMTYSFVINAQHEPFWESGKKERKFSL